MWDDLQFSLQQDSYSDWGLKFHLKIGIKVGVSTLCQDSYRPEDTPLPMCGPPLFLSEKSDVKMANAVVPMRSIKARFAGHNVMAMANSMQKVTLTANKFKNDSVLSGCYQSWIS